MLGALREVGRAALRDEREAGEEAEHDEHRRQPGALAHAVDAKDSYTRSHCRTVSQLCTTIGAELGFTGERLGRMRLAGLLHDVGKIGVPDAILNKLAKLTDAEYAVMQRHATLGGDSIPLEWRIIVVADALEAMTSDRPYRKAPGQEFAIAELRRHAGTQFDPEVVAALWRVLDRGGVGRTAEPAPA